MKYKKPIAVALAAGLIGFTGCASQPAPDGVVNNNYRYNVSRSARTVRNTANNGLGYNQRYIANRSGVYNATRNAANSPTRSTNVRNAVNRATDGRIVNHSNRYGRVDAARTPSGINVNRVSQGTRNNPVTRGSNVAGSGASTRNNAVTRGSVDRGNAANRVTENINARDESGSANAVSGIRQNSPISQRNAHRQNVRVTQDSARQPRQTAPTRQAAPRANQQHTVNRQAPKAPVRQAAPKNAERQAVQHAPARQHTVTRQTAHNAPARQHAATGQTANNAPAGQHAAAGQTAHNAPISQHAVTGQTANNAPAGQHTAAGQTAHNAPVNQHAVTGQTAHNAPVGRHAVTGQAAHNALAGRHAVTRQTTHSAPVRQHAATGQAAPYRADSSVNMDSNRINRARPQNVQRNNYYNASQGISRNTRAGSGFAAEFNRDGLHAPRARRVNPDGTINNRSQSAARGTGTVYRPGYPINRGRASNAHGDIITRGETLPHSGNTTTQRQGNHINRSANQRVTNDQGRFGNSSMHRPTPSHTVQRGSQNMATDALYRGDGYSMNDLAYRNPHTTQPGTTGQNMASDALYHGGGHSMNDVGYRNPHTTQRGTTGQNMTSDALYHGSGHSMSGLAHRNII